MTDVDVNHILDTLAEQLNGIEQEVLHLEAYVTSDDFEMQYKLWDLES